MRKLTAIFLCSSLLITAPGLPFYSALAQVNPAPKPGPASFSGSFPGLGTIPPAARPQLVQDFKSYVDKINSIPLNPYTFPQKLTELISQKIQSPQATASEKLAGALIVEALSSPTGAVGRTCCFFEGWTGSEESEELLVDSLKELSVITNILHSQPQRHESVLIALVPVREALASTDFDTLKAQLDSLFAGSGTTQNQEPSPIPTGPTVSASKPADSRPSATVAPAQSGKSPKNNAGTLRKSYPKLIEQLTQDPKVISSGAVADLMNLIEKNPKAGLKIAEVLIPKLPLIHGDNLEEALRVLSHAVYYAPSLALPSFQALISKLSEADEKDRPRLYHALGWLGVEHKEIRRPIIELLLDRLPSACPGEQEEILPLLGLLANQNREWRPLITEHLARFWADGARPQYFRDQALKALGRAVEKDPKRRETLVLETLKELPGIENIYSGHPLLGILTNSAKKDRHLREGIIQALVEKLKNARREDILEIWTALWQLAKERPKALSQSLNALIIKWSKTSPDNYYSFRYNFVQILAGLTPKSMAMAVPALLSHLSQNPSDSKLDDILQVLAKAAKENKSLWGPIVRSLTETALKALEAGEESTQTEQILDLLNMANQDSAGFTHVAVGLLLKTGTASESELPGISRLMGRLSAWHIPQLRQALWERLKGFLNEKSEAPSLQSEKSHRWFRGQNEVLKRRMPTLFGILQSPQKLGKFLMVLSLLRLAYPYNLFHSSDRAALAEQVTGNGIVFGFEELRIVPVSESFRRHIVYVEDKEGRFAVELKMPGEMEKKAAIHEEHFTIAQQLWGKYPDDPGVAQPIYFSRFEGEIPLYGKKMLFDKENPLGVMIFKYEDGRRFYRMGKDGMTANADAMIAALAASKGTTKENLIKQALTDAAVTAIRLHRLGWRGHHSNPEIGTDMHAENWRVLSDGRGMLVGDFGAFEKTSLAMEQRSKETLDLLGNPDNATLAAIYSEVFRRLTKGIESPEERLSIEKEVLLELNLLIPRS